MKRQKDTLKNGQIRQNTFAPLFTFFFYSHSHKEYDKLREEFKSKWVKGMGYDGELKNYYQKNKKREDNYILLRLELEYPTPLYWNDIAGFIPIKIEDCGGTIRVIAEVWSIKNRKFKTNRIFNRRTYLTKEINKRLLSDHLEFNRQFFDSVEQMLKDINKRYLKKNKFYFSIHDNRLNLDFIKTANPAVFLKKSSS